MLSRALATVVPMTAQHTTALPPRASIQAVADHYDVVGQFSGQQRVLVGGREVHADNLVTTEYPRPIQWVADDSIWRYAGTYRVDLRIVAA